MMWSKENLKQFEEWLSEQKLKGHVLLNKNHSLMEF
jgi:hypothetical protein